MITVVQKKKKFSQLVKEAIAIIEEALNISQEPEGANVSTQPQKTRSLLGH